MALCGVVCLCLLVLPAQALVVEINLGWGWDATANTDLLNYDLQVGSIVQVVLFNSATGDDPGTDADDNFDPFSVYGDTPIQAEPYYDPATGHLPSDLTIYDPNTVPDGHTLGYTTQIGGASSNPGGFDWYNVVEQFTVLGTFDSLYIRVFGTTDFDQGVVISSYWGYSDVATGGGSLDFWDVTIDDTSAAGFTNYFEVIPEPGTMALFLLGGTGLLAGARRRKTRS